MMYLNLSHVAILNIHCADFRCIINRISTSEAKTEKKLICLEKTEHYETQKTIITFKNG